MHAELETERRSLEAITSVIVRPVMFVLLTALLWGTLIAGSFFWQIMTEGIGAAARFVPREQDAPWSWLQLGLGLTATITWAVGIAALFAARATPKRRHSRR